MTPFMEHDMVTFKRPRCGSPNGRHSWEQVIHYYERSLDRCSFCGVTRVQAASPSPLYLAIDEKATAAIVAEWKADDDEYHETHDVKNAFRFLAKCKAEDRRYPDLEDRMREYYPCCAESTWLPEAKRLGLLK